MSDRSHRPDADIEPAVEAWLEERLVGLRTPSDAVQRAVTDIHTVPQARRRALGLLPPLCGWRDVAIPIHRGRPAIQGEPEPWSS